MINFAGTKGIQTDLFVHQRIIAFSMNGETNKKWTEQCHKDLYKNSRMRLEYVFLLFDESIMNTLK